MLLCILIFGIYVLLYLNFCGLLLLSFISYIQILHASHHPPFPSKIRVHPWTVGSSHHTTRGVPYHSECLCRLRNKCLLRSGWLSYFVPEHILHNWQMTSIRLSCRDHRWNGWVFLLEISIDEKIRNNACIWYHMFHALNKLNVFTPTLIYLFDTGHRLRMRQLRNVVL